MFNAVVWIHFLLASAIQLTDSSSPPPIWDCAQAQLFQRAAAQEYRQLFIRLNELESLARKSLENKSQIDAFLELDREFASDLKDWNDHAKATKFVRTNFEEIFFLKDGVRFQIQVGLAEFDRSFYEGFQFDPMVGDAIGVFFEQEYAVNPEAKLPLLNGFLSINSKPIESASEDLQKFACVPPSHVARQINRASSETGVFADVGSTLIEWKVQKNFGNRPYALRVNDQSLTGEVKSATDFMNRLQELGALVNFEVRSENPSELIQVEAKDGKILKIEFPGEEGQNLFNDLMLRSSEWKSDQPNFRSGKLHLSANHAFQLSADASRILGFEGLDPHKEWLKTSLWNSNLRSARDAKDSIMHLTQAEEDVVRQLANLHRLSLFCP